MSYPLVERNDAVHHFAGFSADSEKHLDDLRRKADAEWKLCHELSDESRQAYASGDGAKAKQLSDQSKKHRVAAEGYNTDASNYAFRDRNTQNRAGDEIDLHGQTVHDAENIVMTRIRAEKERNGSHLRIITGQGIHSAGHVAKLKPAIEQLLTERGFKWHVEEHNAGRIYVELSGDQDLSLPPPPQGHPAYGGHASPEHGQGQGYQRPPAGQYGNGPGNAANDDIDPEKLARDAISKCASCCIVM